MMGVKLCSAEDPQIIQSNAGKQFSTCKHNRETLGKVISIAQSAQIQSIKVMVWTQLEN